MSRRGNRRAGDHAVVLGGGIAGLFAARILADHYAAVTVVERDRLSAAETKRRGTPQSQHSHGLLMRAADIAESRFPGLIDELITDGAKAVSAFDDFRAIFFGNVLYRAELDRTSVAASRPFLESHVRARVSALPNVTIWDDAVVAELVASDTGVGGVRLMRRETEGAPEPVRADLVVDAMGRGSRAGAWLESLGYPRPREDQVPVDIGYATCHLPLAISDCRWTPPAAIGSSWWDRCRAGRAGSGSRRRRGICGCSRRSASGRKITHRRVRTHCWITPPSAHPTMSLP